ncbi:ParB N-terminal domain-containing protein [Curtobacterium sp. TC1]|uniref:ParB N-terminal domain-containing protein n=1 Tax=Curtobacterium sp. TC1 TaxID=2862880 RepID=UPI001C9A9E09|nr:ParB N-terminal domain-containing protein [Curtobacterium sp. TC1]QZQ54450.1 ParB N-terminal domain-containing protein [Curtobacterium sp. TC1]
MGDVIDVVEYAEAAPRGLVPYFAGKQRGRHERRVSDTLHVSGVVAPVIVDQDNRIIDGEARVRAAVRAEWASVPTVRVRATETQARLLRFLLNKAAEFQRWDFAQVDDFLAAPQNAFNYLASLEPLGFFGERVIPESFMADSMRAYTLDGTPGQARYRQEPAYAEWAERRREAGVLQARARAKRVRQRLSSMRLDGAVPLNAIRDGGGYKRPQWEKRTALKRAVAITGFVAPLILDQDLTVIDGMTRLEVIRELHAEGWWPRGSVPALIVKRSAEQSSYLRMVLNRTSEFQAWDWAALYSFADTHPQLRPVYEPYGLYTAAVLPDIAWTETALPLPERTAAPTFDSTKQSLGEWARVQRARAAAKDEEAGVSPVKPGPRELYATLVDLSWEPDELLPIHDAPKVMQNFIDQLDVELGGYTAKQDAQADTRDTAALAARGELPLPLRWQS